MVCRPATVIPLSGEARSGSSGLATVSSPVTVSDGVDGLDSTVSLDSQVCRCYDDWIHHSRLSFISVVRLACAIGDEQHSTSRRGGRRGIGVARPSAL